MTFRLSRPPDGVDAGPWFEVGTELVTHYAARWRTEPQRQLHSSRNTCVFQCIGRRGEHQIMKFSNSRRQMEREAAALRVWGGVGAPRLIESDVAACVLLMEAARPGTTLPTDLAVAVAEVPPVVRQLHRPLERGSGFASQEAGFAEWVKTALAWTDPEAAGVDLMPAACQAAGGLLATTSGQVLLHGDLLPKNLVLDRRGYLAIDAIPRMGDPCSDIGFFAAGTPPARDLVALATKLADELGYDADRAARWAAVWAVGEACETWRDDSDQLQAWIAGPEASSLLAQQGPLVGPE